jgi:hypothetical protein
MDATDVTSEPVRFDMAAALAELHGTTDPVEFLAMIQRVNESYRAAQEARSNVAEPTD